MNKKLKLASRAGSQNATAPPAPPRLRLKLATSKDLLAEAGRLYRLGRSGQRDVGDVSRLANVIQIMSKLIETGLLEKRIEQLEQQSKETQ